VDSTLQTGNYLIGEILNQFAVFIGLLAILLGGLCLLMSLLRW
jgi:hypothetical protein